MKKMNRSGQKGTTCARVLRISPNKSSLWLRQT